MKWLAIATLLVALSAVAAVVGRRVLRRRRWRRRLELSASRVEAAVAGGRLPASTGETLLQHLEGLRREISRGTGG